MHWLALIGFVCRYGFVDVPVEIIGQDYIESCSHNASPSVINTLITHIISAFLQSIRDQEEFFVATCIPEKVGKMRTSVGPITIFRFNSDTSKQQEN